MTQFFLFEFGAVLVISIVWVNLLRKSDSQKGKKDIP